MSYGQAVRTAPMSAVHFDTHRHAEVVSTPVPEPGPGEVLVQITSAGICGSDVTALAGGHPFRKPPLVTGHEGGGVVVASGDEAGDAWIGKAVAIEPQRTCGHCVACVRGLRHLCRNRVMLGMPQWSGTLAGFVVAPIESLYPVDASVDRSLLALAEPLAVAHHAVRRVERVDGARTAVLGGGAIGALICYFLHRFGAEQIILSDPRERSRELCATFGATDLCDPTVQNLTAFAGALDSVFVAAAIDRLVDDAVRLLLPRGTVVQVGLFARPLSVDVAALQQDEKTLTGSNVYGHEDFAAAVAALESDAELLGTMADTPIPLSAAAEHLNQKVRGNPDDSIKVLVSPADGTTG